MSNKVEDFFITPLEAHFESQPTEGARDTILTDMEQYSGDDLSTAVEWLKRARQAQKTFPSPKECIKAIAAVVGGRSERAVIRGTEIDASNYAINALAFCAGMKELPIIKEGEPQWDEWLAYWRWLECKWVLDLVYDRKSWTVPTQFPSQFDKRFNFLRIAAE
jgi:hypothetical protein